MILIIENWNVQIKYLLKEPRPYWYEGVTVLQDFCGTEYGFPSGHCHAFVAFYGYFLIKIMNWRNNFVVSQGMAEAEYRHYKDTLILPLWILYGIIGILIVLTRAYLAQNFLYLAILSLATGYVNLCIFNIFDEVMNHHFLKIDNKAVLSFYTIIPIAFQLSSVLVYALHEDTVTDEQWDNILEQCPGINGVGLFAYWQFIPICAFPAAIFSTYFSNMVIKSADWYLNFDWLTAAFRVIVGCLISEIERVTLDLIETPEDELQEYFIMNIGQYVLFSIVGFGIYPVLCFYANLVWLKQEDQNQ